MESEFFSDLVLDPYLDAPEFTNSPRLGAILGKAIEARSPIGTQKLIDAQMDPARHWDASHFGLDRVATFQALPSEAKDQVLRICSEGLLREAYFIEKGGMYYTAKMSLLSQTTQERMLYSQFAADEALHFHWISQFMPAERAGSYQTNPFIALLNEVARREDKLVLTYILQVILEGWGIHHYHELAQDCRTEELKLVFERILRDEARHHGSGVVIFNATEVPVAALNRVSDILLQFFRLVQCGPQHVVGVVAKVAGVDFQSGSSAKIKLEQMFSELGAESETQRKLGLLRDCICGVQGADHVLEFLEQNGAFRALTASECAETALQLAV